METKNIVKFVLAALIVFVIFKMLSKKSEKFEEEYSDYDQAEMSAPQATLQPRATSAPATASGAPMATSVDLLPKTSAVSGEFGEFAPKSLGTQNFLDASRFIGVDTQGSSLRNANYQLRRDPPVTRKDTGPWQQSTLESDPYRRALDC